MLTACEQADDAETGRRSQRLLDITGCRVDEDEVLQVLDDKSPPVVGQGEVDRPARKEYLLSCRQQDLVRRDDDSTIGLAADPKAFLLVGNQALERESRADEGQNKAEPAREFSGTADS